MNRLYPLPSYTLLHKFVNPLSSYWRSLAGQDNDGMPAPSKCWAPLVYLGGMAGYALSLITRVVGVVKDFLIWVASFFISLAVLILGDRIDRETAEKFSFKLRSFVFLGAVAEVGIGIIGTICPPVGYSLDEWIRTNETLDAYSYPSSLSSTRGTRMGDDYRRVNGALQHYEAEQNVKKSAQYKKFEIFLSLISKSINGRVIPATTQTLRLLAFLNLFNDKYGSDTEDDTLVRQTEWLGQTRVVTIPGSQPGSQDEGAEITPGHSEKLSDFIAHWKQARAAQLFVIPMVQQLLADLSKEVWSDKDPYQVSRAEDTKAIFYYLIWEEYNLSASTPEVIRGVREKMIFPKYHGAFLDSSPHKTTLDFVRVFIKNNLIPLEKSFMEIFGPSSGL